jgi:outer membrane protein, heavy metal efflux system
VRERAGAPAVRVALALALALALAIPLAPPPASAERPPSQTEAAALPAEITLAEVLALARQHSPRLTAAAATIDVAAAERVAARLRPNPSVSAGVERALRGADPIGGTEVGLSIGIPVELGGRRAARIRVAERQVIAARAEVAALAADLVLEAALLHTALAAAEARLGVLEQTVTDVAQVEAVIVGRARSGAASRFHAERAHLEVVALRARLAEAIAAREDLAGLLARRIGAPGWSPRTAGLLAPLGIEAADPGAAVSARLPALVATRERQATAAAAIAAARTLRWPVPEIVLGGFATSEPRAVAGVAGIAVPLPLFDRGQGERARAGAEAAAAGAEHRATELESLAELERARRLLDRRRAALHDFEEEAIARLPGLRQMAEQSYLQGQSGIGELLDTIAAITDVQLDHVGLVEGVLAAELDYLAAAGRLDEL